MTLKVALIGLHAEWTHKHIQNSLIGICNIVDYVVNIVDSNWKEFFWTLTKFRMVFERFHIANLKLKP